MREKDSCMFEFNCSYSASLFTIPLFTNCVFQVWGWDDNFFTIGNSSGRFHVRQMPVRWWHAFTFISLWIFSLTFKELSFAQVHVWVNLKPAPLSRQFLFPGWSQGGGEHQGSTGQAGRQRGTCTCEEVKRFNTASDDATVSIFRRSSSG